MGNLKLTQVKQLLLLPAFLKSPQIYLLGVTTSLAVLHLSLVHQQPGESRELSIYALGWVSIILLFWTNRQQSNYSTSRFWSFLGLALLGLVIFRPLALWRLDVALFRVGPVIITFGLGLLAFGWSRLQRQWRAGLILCLMFFPYRSAIDSFLENRLQFSHLTAATSAFFLHYIGWRTTSYDEFLTLATGQVKVGYACTGGALIVWLLKISLLLMLIFRLKWSERLKLICCAIGTGFLVGCVRVALLAVVVGNHKVFEYWHGSQGAQIFLAIVTLIFVGFCNWLLPLEGMLKAGKRAGGQGDTKTRGLSMLAIAWAGVGVACVYLVRFPTAGITVPNYSFPDQLPLSGWQMMSAKTLSSQTVASPLTPVRNLVQSGKQYTYLKSNQQLQLQMRLVVNTHADINDFLKQITGTQALDSKLQINKLDGIGYYALNTDEKQAHLTACINPRGGSTVTAAQFNHNRSTYDFTWSRIGRWALGREILADNRCIWVQLSTGLNPAATTDAYLLLESVLAANYTRWQSQFPPSLSAISIVKI